MSTTTASGQHDDFGDVRDQLQRLRDEGGTYRAIAAAAGLSPSTVHALASGRAQPTPHTTRALSKVTSDRLSRARVDAGGSRLRLRALHVMGHGSARIARGLGVREMTIRRIVRGDAPTVSTGPGRDHRPIRRLVGQARPPTGTATSGARPPPPAAAPSPGTGAPAPAQTTTTSTPPATGRQAAGSTPPGPARPPTSTCPRDSASPTAREPGGGYRPWR